MIMVLDAKQARHVFSTRGANTLELRLALLFKTPKESDRLTHEEFAEALDDGAVNREEVRQLLNKLTSDKILVPVPGTAENADVAHFASEAESIAQLLQSIVGDLVAMGAWASENIRIDGSDPAAYLSALRMQMALLQNALIHARGQFLTEQLRCVTDTEHKNMKLNLGCGTHAIQGWTNIDLVRGDMRLNLAWDLPFKDDSARFVYSAHMFEHLNFHTVAPRLAREIFRVLSPGGVLRLAVPDIEAYINEYANGNDTFFSSYDRLRPEFGRPAGYSTNLSKVMFMAGSAGRSGTFFEHKMGYDFETLAEVLRKAGFETVERRSHGVSEYDELGEMDAHSEAAGFRYDGVANTLFVEATK